MTTPGSAPPQLSPDGHWWWDGTEWTPASEAARAQAAAQAAAVLEQVPEQVVAEQVVAEQVVPEQAVQPQPVPAAVVPAAHLAHPVGAKSHVSRCAAHLGRPVLAATQVESRGGVGQSLLLGSGTGLVGLLFRKAIAHKHRAIQAQTPGQQVSVPRHALVALTADALHVIPATEMSRPTKGGQTFSVPLGDVVAVRVDEQRMVTRFEIDLRDGQTLIGETKRIGANRHNTPALRLIGERAAAARTGLLAQPVAAVPQPAQQVVSYGSVLPAQVPASGGIGRGRVLAGAAGLAVLGVVGGAVLLLGGDEEPAAVAAAPRPATSPSAKPTLEQQAMRSLLEAANAEESLFTETSRYTRRLSDLKKEGWEPSPVVTVAILSATRSAYCLVVTINSDGRGVYYDSAHGGVTRNRCA